jgi:hypothetical protein
MSARSSPRTPERSARFHVIRKFARQRDRRGERVPVGDRIEQATALLCVRWPDMPLQDHVEGMLQSHQSWQTLNAAGTGQQTQVYFRRANLSAQVNHTGMTSRGKPEATAHRHAVQCSHDRLQRRAFAAMATPTRSPVGGRA